jgi:acetyl esterase/lipase
MSMRFKRLGQFVVAVGLCAVLSGCSAADALNMLVPSAGYTRYSELAYGAGPRRGLDVYEPSSTSPAGGRTVVVFLYGGSWRGGKRETYKFVGEALASKGYVAVIPDYRVHPEAVYPAFVEDAAQAVKWVAENAQRYGANPDRIVLMGHSAGAHIAVLTALDPQFLNAAGLTPDIIKGFVGLAGPYSFDPLEFRTTRAVFAHLPDPQVARPVIYAKNPGPPMLLLHGDDDTTVGPHNAVDMTAALKLAGRPVTHTVYKDVGHVGIVLALAAPFRSRAPTLIDSAAFIDALFPPAAAAINAAQ